MALTRKQYTIVGLGELLWDLFPDRRRLGGAPANVAYHAAVLGDRGVVASRVGEDEHGREALSTLARRGVDTSQVQRDAARVTGTARVSLSGGEPTFEIDTEAAWAGARWTAGWEALLGGADLLCFGTMLCASREGRALMERAAAAVPAAAIRLLDLNLRPPLDGVEGIDTALSCANLVKINEEEAAVLAGPSEASSSDVARRLLTARRLRAVAITRGANGSLLFSADGALEHPGVPLPGAAGAGDPVGAGDAFTAALGHHLVRGHDHARASAAANTYAAFVASRRGAMPRIPPRVRRQIVDPDRG